MGTRYHDYTRSIFYKFFGFVESKKGELTRCEVIMAFRIIINRDKTPDTFVDYISGECPSISTEKRSYHNEKGNPAAHPCNEKHYVLKSYQEIINSTPLYKRFYPIDIVDIRACIKQNEKSKELYEALCKLEKEKKAKYSCIPAVKH